MTKVRPGDFSSIWPLLTWTTREHLLTAVHDYARRDTAALRVNLHRRLQRDPRLTRETRAEISALLSLLEDRS